MSDGKLLLDRRQLLLTAASAASLCVIASPSSVLGDNPSSPLGRSQPFDLDWRFRRGEGTGYEARDVDDSQWRAVDLPHDWSIEDVPASESANQSPAAGPFTRNSKGAAAVGFSLGGEGWYRKRFHLVKPANGRVEVLFDGIYMNSDAWLNGQHLGNHPSGYTPVAYDLTPHLAADGNNVLAVRVRNTGQNSRWYSGSGIYRSVWLDVLPEQTRLARWGVGIFTRRLVDASAEIEITTAVEDFGPGLTLVSIVKDPNGRVVTQESTPVTNAEVKQRVSIGSPQRWSPDTPTLYTLESELRRGDTAIDRASNAFGVRIVAFDAARGMTLNGVSTKLRGGCIHHDHGLLGAAVFAAAEERKVRLLKTRGFNAVRPSHNPFSRSFLDACDRHGLFVIAETFDAWREPKLPQDYAMHFDKHWRADLATMVLSARNHPSIVMWSIGNEIPGRNTVRGLETQWQIANEVHRLDPTRPVTAALNSFAGRPVIPSDVAAPPGRGGIPDQSGAVFLDVTGYNYKLDDYEADHRQYPQKVLYGSESFPKDVAAIWQLTDKSPWLIGDFVWTAMDYLGEAGIGGSAVVAPAAAANPMATMAAWPWVNAFCGDIDLIGQPKPQSLARDVVWGLSRLELAVQRPTPEGKVEVVRPWGWADEQPHWTWPGREGKPLAVRVYTSGDRVELWLNGRKLESKPVSTADLQRVEFNVAYEAGALEARSFLNGKEIARKQLTTVGAPAAIRLRPERTKSGAARGDISYVAIEIVDSHDRVVPEETRHVQLAITGPAELIAFGSANPLAVGSFQSPAAQSWNGRALAIIRGRGRAGRVSIEASGQGLRSDRLTLRLSTHA